MFSTICQQGEPHHSEFTEVTKIQLKVRKKSVHTTCSVKNLNISDYGEIGKCNIQYLLMLYHNIGHIWQNIMTDACKTLANVLVTSQQEYDNALCREDRILQPDYSPVPINVNM